MDIPDHRQPPPRRRRSDPAPPEEKTGMAFLTEKQRVWLGQHGVREEKGWECRTTGEPIFGKPFHQTLYGGTCSLDEHLSAPEAPQDRGGEIRTVTMLWCTSCGKEPKKLEIDSPVVEVA
jgi:hypothetical protein